MGVSKHESPVRLGASHDGGHQMQEVGSPASVFGPRSSTLGPLRSYGVPWRMCADRTAEPDRDGNDPTDERVRNRIPQFRPKVRSYWQGTRNAQQREAATRLADNLAGFGGGYQP